MFFGSLTVFPCCRSLLFHSHCLLLISSTDSHYIFYVARLSESLLCIKLPVLFLVNCLLQSFSLLYMFWFPLSLSSPVSQSAFLYLSLIIVYCLLIGRLYFSSSIVYSLSFCLSLFFLYLSLSLNVECWFLFLYRLMSLSLPFFFHFLLRSLNLPVLYGN